MHGLFQVYLQIRSESWEGFTYSRRSHASLPSRPVNRAVQYLRRLSQDPPTQKKEQSISLISRIGIFIVYNVFLLLVIYCCNKASNQIVTRSKELVFYSWIPLSPEVSRLFPIHTHAQHHTRTSRTFYTFAFNNPFNISMMTYLPVHAL